MTERKTMLLLYLALFLVAWFVVVGLIWSLTAIVKDAVDPGHKADRVLDEMEQLGRADVPTPCQDFAWIRLPERHGPGA